MSATDTSSDPLPKGKRYSKNEELGWPSLNASFHLDADIEEEASEGGLRAWFTVVGSSLVYFATFGIINSFGFFQDYYEHAYLQGVPATTISFVGTLQITLMNVFAAPAGALFDCYGLDALYVFSGICSSGALLGLSFTQSGSLWQIFLVQGVLIGIANAFGSQPALVVVGQHFVRRRALVMGLVAAAGSVGGVCFPIIFSKLAALHSVGYAWSLRIVAGIIALCYATATLISFTNMPKQRLCSAKTLFDIQGFADRRYSVLAIGAFIAMLGQFVPYYYISTYMQATNPTSPAKDYLLPLMNASSFIGRILGSLAADAAGPANTVSPMTILSGLLCLGTWAVTSSVSVIICFVSLFGFCSGVFIAVLPVIVAQITPDANLGGRVGAFYSICAVAQLVGSPIGGALIRKSKTVGGEGSADRFLGLIMFAGATLLVGGVVILVSRLLHDRHWRVRY
ncbi:MFS general substrate transporter [Bimuria novae-zelandiae CBS 107.79]|uniref:MFS general substrate transporter n=1 Tax=Bimuria novae-zelandiae CBS 107.79 TaxID=1447943 RepID=A0A6A5VIF0_9PLEO|nr:MFS general substrate transporter [Bimuria novae-zelandiae CBS 107.79]